MGPTKHEMERREHAQDVATRIAIEAGVLNGYIFQGSNEDAVPKPPATPEN